MCYIRLGLSVFIFTTVTFGSVRSQAITSGMMLENQGSCLNKGAGIESVWLEALPLPYPLYASIGIGVDFYLWDYSSDSTDDLQSWIGLRLWRGISTDETIIKGSHDTRFMSDYDMLAYYKQSDGRLSLSIILGITYREVLIGSDITHAGPRLKYGIELNHVVSSILAIRLRVAAASFGNAFRAVEIGPIAVGIALGWFN